MARTKAIQRYHDAVQSLGCVLCDMLDLMPTSRTTLHHIREGQGMGQRASDWLVVPLCEDCHQGKGGIHGDRSLLKIAKVEELDLLAETQRRLFVERQREGR